MVALMGDTGAMKTATAIYLCLDLLKNNPNIRVCFFQKEMPIADMIIRIKSFFTKIENNKIKNRKDQVDEFFNAVKEEKTDTDRVIKSVLERFYIVESSKFNNIQDMEEYILATKSQVYVLDYLALLANTSSDSGNFNDGVQSLCYDLKNFTTEHNLLGIVLTQLKKGTIESRTNKIPMLDDMEWSGALKQVCSCVMAVYYPYLYYTDLVSSADFYLVIRKGRYGQPKTPISFVSFPEYHRFKYLKPDTPEQRDSLQIFLDTIKNGKNGIR